MAEQFSAHPITIGELARIEVRADRNSLRRVLINLLDNAMKPQPGALYLEIEAKKLRM